MNIGDVLQVENINLDLSADSKLEVLEKMSNMLKRSNSIKNANTFLKDVLEREKLGFTGAGNKIAIPHGISGQVDNITVAIAKVKNMVFWDTLQHDIPREEQDIKFIILFAVPDKEVKEGEIKYIEVLKTICGKLTDKQVIDQLMKIKEASKVIEVFRT